MTYLESLAMIERLKNLVSAYCEDWVVYFHFTSETEFEVRYLFKENWLVDTEIMLEHKWKHRFPYGRMWMHDEHVFFVYSDKNFYSYGYNFVFHQVDEDYVLSERFAEYEMTQALRTLPGNENFRFKPEDWD